MVTWVERGVVGFGILLVVACGAVAPIGGDSGGSGGSGGGSAGPSGNVPPGATPPGPQAEAKYPGTGFIVHEWGTNTIVVGSGGQMQRGLHHEEEDLPGFVYDRLKAGGELGTSVDVKMETPVTYFYSDKPLTAQVKVAFPQGVLTQWYPAVRSFSPWLAYPGQVVADPVMDPRFTSPNATCVAEYADGKEIANGLLDWGAVNILARGTTVAPPDAPIDQYTWSHARAVDSNPLAITVPGRDGSTSTQNERFLFYRGLGNLSFPLDLRASADGNVVAMNLSKVDMKGAVFFLDVAADSGAFVVHAEGLDGGGEIQEPAGAGGARPIDAYSDALGAAMTAELDKTGLYHDEAVAMVNTWKRQWFKTPGRRVLYLAPAAWTDAQIPLTIDPAPDQVTRVMVIRVEVLTPALEGDDVKYAGMLDVDYASGSTHFKALGRFAEPRLRRAVQLLGGASAGCQRLLGEIASPNTSAGTGE
jgi:hypothetical protein